MIFGAVADAGSLLFDPLNLSEDVESFEDLKVKEIKNGRLAMVAWAGFFVQVRPVARLQLWTCMSVHAAPSLPCVAQGAVTKQGPLENLQSFVADPAQNNVFKYLG